ncbi:MAG: sporulation integral membrane protein YtvI [Velocimicrobium sp.]
MRGKDVYIKIMVDFLIALVVVLFIVFAVPKTIRFFLPFVIGWIIAMIANPVVKFLEKKVKIVRKHSSAIFIIVAIAAVVCLCYFGISFLGRQIISLINDLPDLFNRFQIQISITKENLSGVYRVMPSNVQLFLDDFINNLMKYLGDAIGNMSQFSAADAGSLMKNVAETFLMAIITIMSAYFFIADRDKLLNGLKDLMPDSLQERANLVKNNFAMAIGGYFKAQFKIMLVIVVILFVGFEILQIDYSFLLALGVAFLDFLPVFGTGTVLFPWALIDLISGNYFEAACLIIIYLVCQVIRQILQPKMVGDSIGLSPLATLVFLFVGYRIKGVLGMIIGIPIGMAVINLYKAGLFDKLIQGLKIVIHDINEFRKY